MAYNVLVVDDSSFFRRRLKEILNQDPKLNVIGEARNGLEAVEQVKSLKPDVVTMDVEMPLMDGITAVKKIMQSTPVPILMFSSLTHDGAQATLDALDSGALDFLSKRFEDIALNKQEMNLALRERVAALARKRTYVRRAAAESKRLTGSAASGKKIPSAGLFMRSTSLLNEPNASTGFSQQVGECRKTSGKKYSLLAIGTSTGGPVALQKVLTALPANFPYPIVIVQHMPGTFTKAFAQRLNDLCKIKVKEAENGERMIPGCAYLAPGGKQMTLSGRVQSANINISASEKTQSFTYTPSVDITFDSVCNVFSGDVLAIILTGMGADGKIGCQKLLKHGAKIWAQDEDSSVVYGMPQAVTAAKIAERSLSINDVAKSILTEMQVK